jgi:3',5'-cyclic AMP phosphodiesterase CpdA
VAEIASLLYVSDLHFFQRLSFKGGRNWALKNIGVKGHSVAKVRVFARTIFTQRASEGNEDILIATGDVSTDGTNRSLEIAKEFIEKGSVYEHGRLVSGGLAADRGQRIIVAGNHDRYGNWFLPYESETNRTLESVFQIRDQYPYLVGFRRPAQRADANLPTILLYVFDSTLTGDIAGSHNPQKRIARGIVTDQDCEWLESRPEELRRTKSVLDLEGEALAIDYENTIRVALLHHHPVIKQKNSVFQFFNKNSWSIMENADRFVEACFKAEVDLVLFGHEHENYNETQEREIIETTKTRVHTIRFICCPSTLEYSEAKNGYYTIDFNANEYRMILNEWNGTAFIKSRTYNQPYNRPPLFQKPMTSHVSP